MRKNIFIFILALVVILLANSSGVLKPQTDTIRSQTFDTFRKSTLVSVTKVTQATQKQVDAKNTPMGTAKSIAYLKLFFLSIIGFILNDILLFYGIVLVIVVGVALYIYRKFRN
jgi:hypothetical protein